MNGSDRSRCVYCGADVPAARVNAHDVLCSSYATGDFSLLQTLTRRQRDIELLRRGRALVKGKKWSKVGDLPAATPELSVSSEVHNEQQAKFENTFVNGGRVGSSRRH